MSSHHSDSAPLRVMELFAGVGGMRLGLERVQTIDADSQRPFQVVWSNQWEPSTRRQHASEVYVSRWGSEGHSNEDIFSIVDSEPSFSAVAAKSPDVLVGGFPCQDYSVAVPADRSSGLEGKKGVLWWSIYRALKRLLDAGSPVKYLLLENVDRLLQSPSKARGRDFAIILSSLASLGYGVEWRVVNAANYGFPQRRRRVFIIGYHQSCALHAQAQVNVASVGPEALLTTCGVIGQALPAKAKVTAKSEALGMSDCRTFTIPNDPLITQVGNWTSSSGKSCFANAGVMLNGTVWTQDVDAAVDDFTVFTGQREAMTLGDLVQLTEDVSSSFYVAEQDIQRWTYLKGSKREPRVTPAGFEYTYSEGPVAFPDSLSKPARTILTSEGGRGASRSTHVVADGTGRLRRLTPEELESLNGFPRGWTKLKGISDAKRAFFMGNALVVGIVEVLGSSLARCHRASGQPLCEEVRQPSEAVGFVANVEEISSSEEFEIANVSEGSNS